VDDPVVCREPYRGFAGGQPVFITTDARREGASAEA
jgi:hypothetical protein